MGDQFDDDDEPVSSDPAVILLQQFDSMREIGEELAELIEAAESELKKSKIDRDALKHILNSAAIALLQLKRICP
jgi:hypothetical protein